eukprot:Clim_evm37s210 gene=Clim_evmTU37s210
MVDLQRSEIFSILLRTSALLAGYQICKGIVAMLFGKLRSMETEMVVENSRIAVFETLLAMTVFREEFSGALIYPFSLLLFIKVLHWLCKGRLEFMEQSPALSWTNHVRIATLCGALSTLDCYMVYTSGREVWRTGPTMELLFGFEYFVCNLLIINVGVRHALHIVDLVREHPLENKSQYLFYMQACLDFVRLIAYSGFFGVILHNYGMPFHIIRDLYLTFRSFLKCIGDIVRYRQATQNMDQKYPDATAEDLAQDSQCVICREDMTAGKKLNCGHIFHFACLRLWLERQQTCPTCRTSVLDNTATNRRSAAARVVAAAQPPQADAAAQDGSGLAAAGAAAASGADERAVDGTQSAGGAQSKDEPTLAYPTIRAGAFAAGALATGAAAPTTSGSAAFASGQHPPPFEYAIPLFGHHPHVAQPHSRPHQQAPPLSPAMAMATTASALPTSVENNVVLEKSVLEHRLRVLQDMNARLNTTIADCLHLLHSLEQEEQTEAAFTSSPTKQQHSKMNGNTQQSPSSSASTS